MKLIILCVETDEKAKTDCAYIDSAIKYFYKDDNDIKRCYKYLEGKGNYKDKRILKEIEKEKKRAMSQNRERFSSHVIYFIDTDKCEADEESRKINQKIEIFCREQGFEFLWFCRDIEEVFLHQEIDKAKKVEISKTFKRNGGLGKATLKSLSAKVISRYKSNFLCVMDQFFVRGNT